MTIRKCRKDGRDPKPGGRLYLYTGQRTKTCRKLGEGICQEAIPIEIDDAGIHYHMQLDLALIPPDEQDELAQADGFQNIEELAKWIEGTHGFPFEGLLICWKLDFIATGYVQK